ncbi:putative Zn-dependent hydrolase [Listeria monocytogenes]|nr:putative Zn-dependent hydrolase [Listeria monocytogenes]
MLQKHKFLSFLQAIFLCFQSLQALLEKLLSLRLNRQYGHHAHALIKSVLKVNLICG